MPKTADKYLEVEPWRIVKKGFHPDRSEISESLFALGNEYMGVRGYFEEGYSGETLAGSYFNGVYEYAPTPVEQGFRGMVNRTHFMINAVDWLYTGITIGGERLDCAKSRISGFVRVLDMRDGTLTRSLIWETTRGRKVRLTFQRFVSMHCANLGCLRIRITPLGFSGSVEVDLGLDFSRPHTLTQTNYWTPVRKKQSRAGAMIMARTQTSGQRLFSSFSASASVPCRRSAISSEKLAGVRLVLSVKDGATAVIDKAVVNMVERDAAKSDGRAWDAGIKSAGMLLDQGYDAAYQKHRAYWENVWRNGDITIDGAPESQQGIRFSIFHLHQAYHGVDPRLNIGAKGLTGEMYWGWTWWDTETYCLPFYLFTNPSAARNLLEYRHSTLPGAIERARQLDCEGARYPMGTIDGSEACSTWQHGDLEIHVSAAVAYGIRHYLKVTNDTEFLYTKGIEVLLQICRYYASRGQWSPRTGEFGFYGVMGADEFHMMVHNNCYTNVMAKKAFEYTLSIIERMRRTAPKQLAAAFRKVRLRSTEIADWKTKARRMRVPIDMKTGIYEQHDGYFDLPRIDVRSIPPRQFPLYKHWAYVRIFRYDMIKQPDVLLLHFFFSHDYSLANKRANFEYYEPRCSHESSLSPAIHSILAAELGKFDKARAYMQHAFRLDLDNYNRNTHEGVHTTSMAAAWMNVVYGYGGMRSDGDALSLSPSMPRRWNSYGFRIVYRGSSLHVLVDKKKVSVTRMDGPDISVRLYGKEVMVAGEISAALPKNRRAR